MASPRLPLLSIAVAFSVLALLLGALCGACGQGSSPDAPAGSPLPGDDAGGAADEADATDDARPGSADGGDAAADAAVADGALADGAAPPPDASCVAHSVGGLCEGGAGDAGDLVVVDGGADDAGCIDGWCRPFATNQVTFNAVWASGPGDVWAAGVTGNMAHWDGSSWSCCVFESDAGAPNPATIYGLWGSAANDLWAVGDSLRHWDGASWTDSAIPGNAGTLYGVWGSGAADVWAVGSGGHVVHWTGAVWADVSSGTFDTLLGVHGSSATDIWAVGAAGATTHWDGHAWTAHPIALPGSARLRAVHAFGPDDAWAVEQFGTIYHWDGCAWSAVARTSTILTALWGSGPSDLWALGLGGFAHWDGCSWREVTSASLAANAAFGIGARTWGAGIDAVFALSP
jgi:hypothetical protein